MTVSKPYVAAAYRRKLALLRDRGFTVGLICPPAWAGQKFESSPDDARYWLRQVPIALDGKNHFHWYRGLAAAVREFRPDVLNVEEEHYSFVTYRAFQIARDVGAVPLFYTWQNILKSYPPPFQWMERAVLAEAAAGVCGNHEATEVLKAKGYAGPTPEIPQMGVTLSLFAPKDSSEAAREHRRRELGMTAPGLWLGYFGRLVPEKGVADLLAAIKIAEARTSEPLNLWVVGGGPEQEALARRARELGLGERVHFRGSVPSVEVARHLQAVDALCLPSLTRSNWKEQFGRVLIEAMAAEAVVVGSSSGEIPRVIADAGLTFPEGDPEGLAEVLVRLIAAPATREDLRARGRDRVRRLYTNDVVADRWGELFARLGAARVAKT